MGSKIGNSGQMIMNNPNGGNGNYNYPYPGNNMGMSPYNMSMNPQMVMGNPYMNYGNNQMMPNQQMYGYMNPQMPMNPPMYNNNMNINMGVPNHNYSRMNSHVGNNGNNYTNNYNSNSNNQPVKIMPPNTYNHSQNSSNNSMINNSDMNNNSLINKTLTKREQDKERIQRSISSKIRNANNNNKSNLATIQEQSTSKGPITNPESFAKRRGNSSNSNTNTTNNYDNSNYKPYTVKDYKENFSDKIVLGSLGPNIGTKDWDEKHVKMKKMEDYATVINKTNQVVLRLKKETPQEKIEKLRLEHLERSNRHKAAEYGKLIKQKPRTSSESEAKQYNGLGMIINEFEEEDSDKLKFMMDYHNKNNNLSSDRDINKRYGNANTNQINYTNENNNMSNISYHKNEQKVFDKNNNRNENNLENLQKNREEYLMKLNKIKESLI